MPNSETEHALEHPPFVGEATVWVAVDRLWGPRDVRAEVTEAFWDGWAKRPIFTLTVAGEDWPSREMELGEDVWLTEREAVEALLSRVESRLAGLRVQRSHLRNRLRATRKEPE